MLNKNAIDFLLYSYFGFGQKELSADNKNAIIMKCAQKAYLDFNRTLRFKKEHDNGSNAQLKKTEEVKEQTFCNSMCDIVQKQIDKLLKADKSSFDLLHQRACEEICSAAEGLDFLQENKNREEDNRKDKDAVFYAGQAQKWLNMTIKYMWLLGLWEDELGKLKEVIHVPVDRFIVEAVWNNEEIRLPLRRKKRTGNYNDDNVISWSKWTYDEYKDFQTDLQKWCRNNGETPLEWESFAWIKIANGKASK